MNFYVNPFGYPTKNQSVDKMQKYSAKSTRAKTEILYLLVKLSCSVYQFNQLSNCLGTLIRLVDIAP